MTDPQIDALGKMATAAGGWWALGHPHQGHIAMRTALALELLGYASLSGPLGIRSNRVYITDAGRAAYTEAMGK